MLWLLALMVLAVGRIVFGFEDSRTLANVYTMPLTNPTNIAETLGMVTGASKKIKPEMAIGNLFSEPTIEYVVEDVVLTHQADV